MQSHTKHPPFPLSRGGSIQNFFDGPSIKPTSHGVFAQELKQQKDPEDSKLIVVSNRLPVSLKKDKDKWSVSMSSGGLVAALSGVPRDSFIWVGWVGCVVPPAEEEEVTALLAKHACVPVFLNEKVADEHYNGFSNGILWPLFHYEPDSVEFDDSLWTSYVSANQTFADVVERNWKTGDPVWVHDIHLMLLPKLLRNQLQSEDEETRIGFFLHIPFPASEVFDILPWKREILQGVLESNLLGFHTYDYATHFMKSCTRTLGLETRSQGVISKNDRFSAVGVFPIGIEPRTHESLLATDKVKERIVELEATFAGKMLIIGVDRLDYIKGIPHKLRGFEELLKTHPEWLGKAILLQVAVPSRMDVPEYQRLKKEIDQLVGHINGEYGSLIDNYSPIQYLFRSVDGSELAALYAVAKCCYITSLRDGMNLVCLEYAVCQNTRVTSSDGPGSLVLSEFAGAATSLVGGSVVVNPWNTTELAEGLNTALTMSQDERREKNALIYSYATKYTAAYWAETFVAELKKINPLEPTSLGHSSGIRASTPTPQKPSLRALVNMFSACKNRLIIFEYDGVLVNTTNLPTFSRPPRKLINNLKELGSKPGTKVYVTSWRDRKTLDAWFPPGSQVGVAAELGFFLRHPDGPWEKTLEDVDVAWRDQVRSVMQYYSTRTPGTFIEETEAQQIWHYSNAEEPFGSIQSRELHHLLSDMKVSLSVKDKRIAVKPLHLNHGLAMRKICEKYPDVDYVIHVGDTWGSLGESVMLPEKTFTFAVGKSNDGRWTLRDTEEVNDFIDQLVHIGV